MKSGFTTLAKVLAICFSFALLSGYVWWRYDTAKKDEQARQTALDIAKKNALRIKALEEQASTDPGESTKEWEIIEMDHNFVMPSSKSGAVMPSSKSGIMMPSSKSGRAISLEELLEHEPDLLKRLQEQERVLIPSSKSGIVPPRSSVAPPKEQSEGK